MKKLLFQSGVLLLLLAQMSTGHAQDSRRIPVFCDRGHSIQFAVDHATEGAILDVFGTCREAVRIQKDHIHLVGNNGATIIPPAGSTAFAVIFTDNVNITGFKILGGARGFAIVNGSSARIIGNQILDSTSVGILIGNNSFAGVLNNLLHSTSDNFSQIFVSGSSAANVFDNTISASGGGGIDTDSASAVTLGGNIVSGTAGAGIAVSQNAHMILAFLNTVNTIFCGFSGSLRVDTDQTITGGAEAVTLDPGCDLDNVAGDPSFPP